MTQRAPPAIVSQPRRFWLALVVLAATAGVVTAVLLLRPPAPPSLERATLLQTPRAVPAVLLADHRGVPFDRGSLAGHWTVLFFGFTHCPDICPTTLVTLAEVRRNLSDLPPRDQPGVVLVTVDPARDTPEVLASYVGHFGGGITGVTGSLAGIEELTQGLGVVMQARPPAADGSYTVDHTAALFLIDPSAAFAAVFGSPHEAGIIARDFRRILSARR